MRSRWQRARADDHSPPVEMRFIDMFMTALGALIFVALLLVFLLPKTTQNNPDEQIQKRIDDLVATNQTLTQQLQRQAAQVSPPGGGKTDDVDLMRRWFDVMLVTKGCEAGQPELYARIEGKVVNVRTGESAPDPIEFDASNPLNRTVFFGTAYYDVGNVAETLTNAIKTAQLPDVEKSVTDGARVKYFHGSVRGGDAWWSVYAGLVNPESQGDLECAVKPLYFSSDGLTVGDELKLTKHQPFAWLRHFKVNSDGTTTLAKLPKDDEDFKRALATFSGKQSKILFDNRHLCNTVDAYYALLVPGQAGPGLSDPKRPSNATLWSYEDSTVYLVSDQSGRRQLFFNAPSCDATLAGAAPGGPLFDGKYASDKGKKTYSGMAYAYASGCTAKSYPVTGEVSDDYLLISLKGSEPVQDTNCNVTGTRDKTLNFTVQASGDRSSAAADHTDNFSECDGCPQMVAVAAGSFLMGSDNAQKLPLSGEPQHIVNIANAFAVGKFEVTVAQFASFVKETGYDAGTKCFTFRKITSELTETTGSWHEPGYPQTGADPATCINWYDAKAYVNWLAAKTHKPYRLLSEAEWEYAARAGTTGSFYFGTDSKVLCKYGNVRDRAGVEAWDKAISKPDDQNGLFPPQTTADMCNDGFAYTSKIGSFPPNGFGLYDIYGNVWEAVEDCANDNYRGAPKDGSAWLSGDCKHRIRRGGSFYTDTDSATRFPGIAADRVADVGFRVARSISPADDCREGVPALAVFSCTRIIAANEMSPGNLAVAYQNRGLTYLRLGQFDKAIADYDNALRLDPKQATSLYGRGLAKRRKGDQGGGDADIAAAKALRPSIADDFAAQGIKS
jgi:formylglycine-generating enzyme required for sulfatase activity